MRWHISNNGGHSDCSDDVIMLPFLQLQYLDESFYLHAKNRRASPIMKHPLLAALQYDR